MASSTVAFLTLIMLLLVSFPPESISAQLRPSCVSQYTLANQACSLVPITEASIDLNHNRVNATVDARDDDDNDNDDDDDDDDDDDGDDDNDDRRGNGHGHRQRHRHGHGHGGVDSEEPLANRECCRWVEDLDEPCVCTTLLGLPSFLIRLKHSYRITVGTSCIRTFKCYGI